MKKSEIHSSESSFVGHVKNGGVVFDPQLPLADGQAVRIEPLRQEAESQLDAEQIDRVGRLEGLFAEWTEEDGKLSDEEADRLQAALEQHRGLGFGKLD